MPVRPTGREDGDDTPAVRPYTMTRGRTRPRRHLPLEALVSAKVPAMSGRSSEERDILALVTSVYLSVAELSAHTKLPLGVVRVLVGDLDQAGAVALYGPDVAASTHAGSGAASPLTTTPISVLESVLDGICAL